MNASSQNPSGALPPELSPVQPPMPEDLRAAYAAYGVAIPAPTGPAAAADPEIPYSLRARAPEPELPECFICGITGPGPLYPDPHGRLRQPSGAQVFYCGTCVPDATPAEAVTAVVAAEMAKDEPVTARDIAAAEVRAGVTFDPQRIEAAVSAALEQARAEFGAQFGAELAAAAQDREAREWFRARWAAAGRLCEGRNLDDILMVGEVLTALDGRAPATLPLTITWDGEVAEPAGDGPGETTLVGGITARGGKAVLVLRQEQRQTLAQQLSGLEVRDPHAKCATDGCGTADDYDATNPFLFGWSRLEIASLGDGPRWYCCDMCVVDALARAGHELAAEDRAAAVDPDQQAPQLPHHAVDEEAVGDQARCVRCGCTDDAACEGGCLWAPNTQNIDLCTSCVTPEELVTAVALTEQDGAL